MKTEQALRDNGLTDPPRYASWRNVEAIWPTGSPTGQSFFEARHLTNVQAATLDSIARSERALAAEQAKSLKYATAFRSQRTRRRVYQVLALLGWAAVVFMGVWG